MTAVGIFVFQGADELDVVGPFRVFAAAGMDVLLVAERGAQIRMGNGLTVQPTATFESCPSIDVLLVPGGSSDSPSAGRRVEQKNETALAFVRARAREAHVMASVCTGAFIAAEAGLLAGKRANTHWAFRQELLDLMRDRGEPFELIPERVVWDGDLVTAGGVTSGIDLALAVVERMIGADARKRVEAAVERETPS
jgi:cyclohexyl-isocyanide hydratase